MDIPRITDSAEAEVRVSSLFGDSVLKQQPPTATIEELLAEAQRDMRQPQIRYLGDLQRLQPQPGDVYVLTVPRCIDDRTAGRLRDYVSNLIGCPAGKVLVLGDGLKLDVVAPPATSKEDAAAAGRGISRAYRNPGALRTLSVRADPA